MAQSTTPERETRHPVFRISFINGGPLIPMEDDPMHTPTNPFCFDPTCGCHESPLLIAEVHTYVSNGLLTPTEATRLVMGTML